MKFHTKFSDFSEIVLWQRSLSTKPHRWIKAVWYKTSLIIRLPSFIITFDRALLRYTIVHSYSLPKENLERVHCNMLFIKKKYAEVKR